MYVSDKDLIQLRRAFEDKNITLYLGAGVSVASGLPTWEKLVLAMYFATISEQYMGGWRPYSNYLYAIAEWHLKNSSEPLEITARKLRKYLSGEQSGNQTFIESLYSTLYSHLLKEDGSPIDYLDTDFFRYNNTTLGAVAALCEHGFPAKGIRGVISYNYDDLLETVLSPNVPHQVIFRNSTYKEGRLPIYHVHGFVPLNTNLRSSRENEIVFTEDQYHTVARDPYYWSNLVQVKSMSSSIGVMIGLSLADRNMRRLLDAIQNAPIETKNFAILQKPDTKIPDPEILDEIHKSAKNYLTKFENTGIKSDRNEEEVLFRDLRAGVKSSEFVPPGAGIKGSSYQRQIAGIIEQVQRLNQEQQEYVMKELGITPIWYKEHSEIPGILSSIFGM